MKVEFYRHNIDENDIKNVSNILRSIFLTTGPACSEFEKKYKRYTGLARIVSVNSCTSALHLALMALGIGPGDEVITTPMTFIASVTPILHCGATPVFIDVEESSGLMAVDRIEAAITDKTKAILPVHLYGSMVDIRRLKEIADANNLKIIEDCAHCIEGKRNGIRPGQISDAACYSFYATKNITSGEGGAIGTNNVELADKLRVLRLHGMSKDAASRYTGHYEHWDMEMLGWKYNMDDIHASLLIDQLDRIDERWALRDRIWHRYDSAFETVDAIEIPIAYNKHARHMYTIWVDPEKRDRYLHQLQKRQIGIAVNFRSVHNLKYFKKQFSFMPDDYPNADRIGNRTLSLPLYPNLKDYEIDHVIESVISIV
ncbi:MAG: DegT/DnrJ/EryC1/StrS family aminotransferase [Desulfobacterales bacterium]|jgi:dTDP-4-amino-4,6-dideoxygalactose transaminase|nr:DegT/DnrJ/EryC1/StrS family aminotransferase [Desulfobacterales bacterium]MDP6806695.1 DegT/DnrJ/EryC1/StrS family aminotransferase [Desulfobacterales bacterium]|tara:strand:+ start:8648 stop:9763 length:1116 start_codon:yes stop_codon:yes gene_type:complete